MLFILAASKRYRSIAPPPALSPLGVPPFLHQARRISAGLRNYSPEQLTKVFGYSRAIATQTHKLFALPRTESAHCSKATAAFLHYSGDVFSRLQADTLGPDALSFARTHVVILSALYGVLHPDSGVIAYRLEMKSSPRFSGMGTMSQFWANQLVEYISDYMHTVKASCVVNTASAEYFSPLKMLGKTKTIITPHFQIDRGSGPRTIAIHAKYARGLFVRFALKNKVSTVEQLQQFCQDGWKFRCCSADKTQLYFTKKIP